MNVCAQTGETCLMAASEKGVLEVVQALLQAGAAVNAGKPVGGGCTIGFSDRG